MILTTTNSIEGLKIYEYKGIVSGISLNVQSMSMTLNLKKYYDSIADSVNAEKEKAFQQIQDQAKNLNANAIVGITVDVEFTSNNFVAVSVTGTAVSVA